MRSLPLVLFTALFACNGEDDSNTGDTEPAEMVSLTVNGTEYGAHTSGGHAIRATLFDSSGAEIDTQEVMPDQDGAWTVTWTDALTEGEDYDLLWYADINGDDACQNPPDDHVWRRSLDAVQGDQTVDHVHSADDFATCT
jgi:hypothetical protein